MMMSCLVGNGASLGSGGMVWILRWMGSGGRGEEHGRPKNGNQGFTVESLSRVEQNRASGVAVEGSLHAYQNATGKRGPSNHVNLLLPPPALFAPQLAHHQYPTTYIVHTTSSLLPPITPLLHRDTTSFCTLHATQNPSDAMACPRSLVPITDPAPACFTTAFTA